MVEVFELKAMPYLCAIKTGKLCARIIFKVKLLLRNSEIKDLPRAPATTTGVASS